MKEFSILLFELVDEISREVNISRRSGTFYLTCNTKWARKGKYASGVDAFGNNISVLITQVLPNQSIRLENSSIRSESLFLDPPFGIVGTKIATNLEWSKRSNIARHKLPLVWLLDTFKEKEEGRESALERTVDCKIFFLDETDIKNFYTADHKREVIQPMIALKDEFLKVVKKHREYKTIESVDIEYFSRFGTESPQGFEKNILDANLSGLLLSVTLQRFKGNCIC
jgi:hypothetical protein